ncbi:long-chain-fatty-acid--CoA ligase [Ferribacterium limneticum]|uniref:long-chain-fatty-acid--CoA ligase n=1 Tax=Ferribacterium limneticum TaxID=76259 RepID=UPI001CF7F952|nr:long-chain-fatty-acid--CoA ligase [Ferribacterium limneticum]UCV23602.1 long-chain-fatty-acid--CoA ligase [Ferribacterium limneticum]
MSNVAQPIPYLDRMVWMADYPSQGATKFPNRQAIIADHGSLTYAELDRKTDQFVAFLDRNAIGPGSRIAYLGKNSELFFPVLFGCLRHNVVLVPINWRSAPGEIAFVLEDSASQLVIFDDEFGEILTQSMATMATTPPRTLITHTNAADSLCQVLNETAPFPMSAPRQYSDSWALLMYTSGTTGRPKGVMLSHKALSISRHLELDSPDWTDWTSDDVILSAMPNFHVGGMSWMLIGLLRSLTCVLTADPSPANLLRLAQTYEITRTFMVPTVIKALLEQITLTATSAPRLKTIFYGASTMNVALLKNCIEVFDCKFAQYFGMTENCGSVTFLPPSAHDITRPALLRSVGKALPGMTIEIRSPNGTSLPEGQAGEIWVQSPTLMSGYWNRPEDTKTALVDGWYRTGDGGYLDENGYLYLTDRIKDMIISGGENIYPVEVEQALREHPAVRDVVVVGIPDPVWGENVVAVVEWHPGQSATLEELRDHAGSRIARYKLPKILQSIAVLPRTSTGKLQRGEVRLNIKAMILATSRM